MGDDRLTTTRFGLSPAEWATTAVAAAVSATAYVVDGFPYLARGVVGDLLGFVVLGATAAALRRRVRHEALICLVLIGAVVALDPQWPLEVRESVWWALFSIGLAGYLAVRRRACR